MTRPDDSLLDSHQLANVLRHADQLLRDASALGRFPTPIDDLMAAAKLTVVDDEVLNESFLQLFLKKARATVATVKSALSKVLGLFEANDRFVVIDKDAPKPRIPFIKLHEAGHGTMPHQTELYKIMHDCEKTLEPDIADLFEREANVFASEVLFQSGFFAGGSRSRVQHQSANEIGKKVRWFKLRHFQTLCNHKPTCLLRRGSELAFIRRGRKSLRRSQTRRCIEIV